MDPTVTESVQVPQQESLGKVINETRSQAKQEVEQAKTNLVLKAKLVTDIKQALKDAETSGKEVVAEEKKGEELQQRGGLLIPTKAEEGKFALKTLIKAAEYAKAGIQISTTRKGQELLVRLAEKSYTSPSVASAIEARLSDYLIGNKDITFSTQPGDKSDFEKAFTGLAEDNSIAAELINRSIIEGQSIIAPNLSEAELRQKLEIKGTQPQAKQRGTQRSVEDEDKFKQLQNEILSKIDESRKLPDGDPNKITDSELVQLNDFLRLNSQVVPTSGAAKLVALRLDQGKITEFIEVSKRMFGSELDLRQMELYAPGLANSLQRAQREFNVDEIRRKFVTQNTEGKFIFTRENRLKFQELITKHYYQVLQKIHQDKSRRFQESMQGSMEYSYFFPTLKQVISRACDDLSNSVFVNNEEVQRFLKDKSSRYQASIMTYAQIMHDLPLLAKDAAQFEKWGEFLGYLFPSELAEVFDEGDRFMQMARDEITMYIRKRLVTNKDTNQYPSDLTSGEYDREGVRWGLKFEKEIREVLKKRVDELNIQLEREGKPKIDLGENDWKLDRAMTYASGIGIANLVDIEVMSTADTKGNFQGIHPLLGVLSARANWQAGRGDPNSGLISKYLLKMDVELYPEMRKFIPRLFNKKKWVPKKFADEVDKQAKMYGDDVLGELFDRGGTYQELLSMINLPNSLISRHGWRMNELTAEMQENFKAFYNLDPNDNWKSWTAEQWKEYFDFSLKEYGNASLWWYLTSGPDRLTNEMKRLLVKQRGDPNEANNEFEEYKSGRKMLEKDFDFIIDGEERRMTYLEIRNMRQGQLRGETFFRYMRRNPGDFILLLTQLAPELVAEAKGGDIGDVFKSLDEIEKLDKMSLDKEKIRARRSELLKRWGEQGFNQLIEVRKWLINSSNLTVNPEPEAKGEKYGKDIKGFMKYLVEKSGTAFEKMMIEGKETDEKVRNIENDPNKPEEQKKKEIAELRRNRRMYLKKEDFFEEQLFETIYATNGLSKILSGEDFANLDNFYEKFGDFDTFGKDNIFYRMGISWTHRNYDVNPFSSDFNHFAVYNKLGGVGEDTPKRWLSDTATTQKVISKIAQLEQLLENAAIDGKLEKIYELHHEMFWTLKNIMGNEYAWKANYLLASIVTQFFWEHSATRQPFLRFPFDLIAKSILDKEVSLSRLLTGNRHAYTMDENAARTYFRKLAYDMHVLPHEGAWSNEQLELAFDAKSDTFIFGDVLPSVGYFMVMFLLWTYIKKALEEAEGKKH